MTYSGRWHHVDGAGINPRPARGRIPVWFGGNADAVLRRAGRIGDGWLPQRDPDALAREMVERVRRHARDAGRDPGDIGFEPRLELAMTPRSRWSEFASDWRELGATHLGVSTIGLGLTTTDEHISILEDAMHTLTSTAVDRDGAGHTWVSE